MPTPLLQKLGIKQSFCIYLYNAPQNYNELLENEYPKDTSIIESLEFQKADFIHFFTNKVSELEEKLPFFQNSIFENGMIWVSWYKKASKKASELNEDIIRDTALALKLVDIKVCSVNEDWSGLKLVIRKELRKV